MPNPQPPRIERKLVLAIVVVALQVVAAVYFVADAIADTPGQSAPSLGNVMELLVALALVAGIVLGARQTHVLFGEARRRENAIAIARGALAGFVDLRFAEWGLSKAEADVALFALKGCSIAEIAEMRRAAQGTVRAQLSQVYAKAGVTSQPMLIALFIEDLVPHQPAMAV